MNEAAERLLNALVGDDARDADVREFWQHRIDGALAAERRATVERILAAVQKKAARYSKDTATGYQVYSIVRGILDAEAAR